VDPAEELERIRRALAEAARRGHRSLRSVSQQMGQHPAYWTRALTGRRPLRLQGALELLAALRVDAEEFFEVLYPLGGAAEAKLTRPGPDLWDRQGSSLRDMMRRARALEARREPTPAELTARAGRTLIAMLRRAGLRQRAASQALGLGPGALGQALRGNAALNVEHVLATLALLDLTPARFFAELFGPDEEDVLAGMRWSRYLDQVEGLVASASGRLLAQKRGDARPKAKGKTKGRSARGPAKAGTAAKGGKPPRGGKAAKGRKPATSDETPTPSRKRPRKGKS